LWLVFCLHKIDEGAVLDDINWASKSRVRSAQEKRRSGHSCLSEWRNLREFLWRDGVARQRTRLQIPDASNHKAMRYSDPGAPTSGPMVLVFPSI
jgi:hypothetical protein